MRMVIKSLLTLYRLLAGIVVLLPLAINLTLQGGITASLIYAPSITLLALIVAVYFDQKIEIGLSKLSKKANSARKLGSSCKFCFFQFK